MRSPTQRDVDRGYVLAAAATAFGDDATVVDAEPFTGGSFGSVWRVELADRGPVVLKISATPDAGLLTYERGMLVPLPDHDCGVSEPGMTPDGDPGRWALLGRLVTDLVDRLTGGATDPGQ